MICGFVLLLRFTSTIILSCHIWRVRFTSLIVILTCLCAFRVALYSNFALTYSFSSLILKLISVCILREGACDVLKRFRTCIEAAMYNNNLEEKVSVYQN